MRAIVAMVLVLASAAGASGQQQARTERVVAIRAGRLIDVQSGTVVENAVIVVRGDRIEAAGREARVPAGAQVIDLSDHTVMPGFIDLHTHITGDPSGGYSDQALHEWPGYEAIVGVKNARKTLLAGFTSIRNLGSSDWADVALRDAIAKDVVPGPRVFAGANSMGITVVIAIRTATGRTCVRSLVLRWALPTASMRVARQCAIWSNTALM